jgi:alpha-glucosidase (family GH31 glycosyl hydrolase)
VPELLLAAQEDQSAMIESASESLRLRHVPHGIEDPYVPQPWERCPREPITGDAVTVAAVTEPTGAARVVIAEVNVGGGDSFVIDARPVPHDGDGDRWEAVLGSFSTGTAVGYRLTAESEDGERASTDWFVFEPLAWHPLGAIASWEATSTQLQVTLTNGTDTPSALALEVLAPNVLRLRAWPRAPKIMPSRSGGLPLSTEADDERIVMRCSDVRIRLGLVNGSLSVEWPGESGDHRRLSSVRDGWLAWLAAPSGHPHAVRLGLLLTEDEALYGSGERFDQLDRRGCAFDFHVYEQYKDQGARTYLPVPLVLSSRGYVLFVTGTRPLQIDAGAIRKDVLEVTAEVGRDPAACLETLVFLATSPLDALQSYLQYVGLPVLPPDWAFGLWMSSNDWNDQRRVMSEVDRARREGIPGDVVIIEAWSDEETFYIWNDAEYLPISADRPPHLDDFRFPPEGRWPDPKGMIDEVHRRGMRILLWQIPLVKNPDVPHPQRSLDVEGMLRHRWCALDAVGEPYRNPGWWFPGALLPDLTNPDAVDWWLSRRRYLVEGLGVDGFKTDGGEHLWGRDLQFADGRKGDEMINAFPVIYAAAYHQLLRDCGREDGLTFSRAGFAGSQLYPAHWAGDENSTWDAFRHSIVAGLSAGASGLPFWGWDIAGFSGEIPSGELYRRAWMMATFCPIMQYHSEHWQREPSRDRTPWNIAERTGDPDVLPVCRMYTAVRGQLRPYIAREARHTAATGRPLMCALCLAFPQDVTCRAFPYEYLFGRDLLVAPTVTEGAAVQRVYLPAGRWRDLWSHGFYDGPSEIVVDVAPDHIPVFARQGALPPLDRPCARSTRQ